MNNYQLIAFDMDGTLLNSDKQISPETLNAIKRAGDAGKTVILCTGRNLAELNAFTEIIPGLRYLDCVSGACVYDLKEKKTLYSQALDPGIVKKLMEFAQEEELVFLCGHYEGIDERVLNEVVTDYVSIGDYVLTGGELPAMIMIDAISRLVPGVLHNDVSAEFESFQDNLLEYPQYSRPEVWHDRKVPEILMSGHHANIEKWRREQSVIRTAKNRPDLLEKAELTEKEKKLAEEVQKEVKKSL